MSDWSVLVYNEKFQVQGEVINIHEVKIDVFLNKVRTLILKVRLDNILATEMAYEAAPRYIKIYRNNILLFFGAVQTAQETGTEDGNATLQINASGPEFIFTQRLISTSAPGTTDSGIKLPAGVQRAVRFKELLAWSNVRGSSEIGETHIDFTTGPISSTNTEAYEAPSWKMLSEILLEMFNQAAGFDWKVTPIEAAGAAPNIKIGKLEMKDVIGEERPNAVFEWGAGLSNVANYTRLVDGTNLLNLGYNFTSAGPEATGAPTVLTYEEAYSKVWGIREGLISTNILNTSLRQTLVKETVEVRKLPRQTIAFTPVTDDGTGRVPVFGKDFNVGDTVPARIVYEGQVKLDALVRVWGAGFVLDQNGKETQSVTLSDS